MAHQQDNIEEAYNAFVGSWFVNAYSSFDSNAQVVCDNVETNKHASVLCGSSVLCYFGYGRLAALFSSFSSSLKR